ncbi:unnamed protein product [Effrenium voratum]|nr:unnamed protein product [Effrenium voratum]
MPTPAEKPGIAGFGELLAGWDQVLQSLDRVNAYTAERANDAAARLAETCKAQRPALVASVFEEPPKPRVRGRIAPPELQRWIPEDFQTSEAALPPPRFASRGSELLERLEQHMLREESRVWQRDLFKTWVEAGATSRSQRLKAQGQEQGQAFIQQVQQSLKAERDTISRLREVRTERCRQALGSWQEVQLIQLQLSVFQVWRDGARAQRVEAAEASQRQSAAAREEEVRHLQSLAQKTEAEAAETLEELQRLRQELSSKDAQLKQSAAALQAAETSEELQRLRQELSAKDAQLKQNEAALQEARRAPAVKPPDESRLVTDLSIRLAKSEADGAEQRALLQKRTFDLEAVKGQLSSARRELEVVYATLADSSELKNLKGLRDRDLALAHLRHLMETLQDPPAPVKEDEGLKRRSIDSPATASTPNLQSSLSLPSLSSASSPVSKNREIEDRKKRWMAAPH